MRRAKFMIGRGTDFLSGVSPVLVYTVREAGQPDHMAIDVWASEGRVNCTKCSGPLQAMLSTCKHAMAVKRRIASDAERSYVE